VLETQLQLGAPLKNGCEAESRASRQAHLYIDGLGPLPS